MFIIFLALSKPAKESGSEQFYPLERLDTYLFAIYTPQTCVYNDFSKEGIVKYIHCRAIEAGVNPQLAERVIRCESNFNPKAKGDGGCSIGIWQINTCVHKDIGKNEAHDVVLSTNWAMPRFKKTPQIWGCY